MKYPWLAALVLAGVHCAPPAPAPPSSPAPAGTPPATAPSGPDARARFLATCASSPELAGYCGCAFDVTTKDFPELLADEKVPTERAEAAKAAIGERCATTLPEAFVKQQFTARCAADEPSFAKYCECSWTEYRKTLSSADIAQDRWRDARGGTGTLRAVAAACGPSLSEAELAANFRQQCVTKPELAKFCDCTWKEARRRFSIGEIVLDAVSWPENDGAAVDIYARCEKLNPDAAKATPKK